MRFPWVSRGQYDAVLAVKDEMIAGLKEQMSALEQRMAAPIEVSVKLPDGFVIQTPAVVSRRSRPQLDQSSPNPSGVKEIDWANVNENDNEAIARIAAQELGGTVPPHVLARTVSQIKMNIRSAKADKVRKALTEGRVGTLSRPLTEDEAIEQGSRYIPADIRELVANAERG